MKSIRRVIIEDFQSHKRTDIELVDGFNVIVGPSDQGKTAVLRAIRWVLFNEPKGSDFIRVGAASTKVTLMMNDGTLVQRIRSSSRNRYIVAIPGMEEQIFEGFGHSVPEEVIAATGVRMLKIDEDHEVAIHLGMQLDPPFLLGNNGALKAKAIGRMNGVHILDYAHKMTNSELNSKQVEERKMEAEIEKIAEQLEQFHDLEIWEKQLGQIDHLFSLLALSEDREILLSRKLEQLLDLSKKLELAKSYLAHLSQIDQAYVLWGRSKDITDRLDRLIILRNRLYETRKSLAGAQEWIQRSSGLVAAQDYLKKVEKIWELEQQTAKAYSQQQATRLESGKVEQILHKTKGITLAEQLFERLLEIKNREEQLSGLYRRNQEQVLLNHKLETVLTKTANLDMAQSLWQRWTLEDQKSQQLIELAQRIREQKNLLNKAENFLQKVEQLPKAEKQIKEFENKISRMESLLLLKQKYVLVHKEKQVITDEYTQIQRTLQELAEEYSEQLKELGRCPICLGEIESHTVERIIKEIS
ncbi:MAG TPA: hypothetical protein VJ824_06290 [Bacillota bacterium]|nr:hypothetical protein [Bacillota bacterium]